MKFLVSDLLSSAVHYRPKEADCDKMIYLLIYGSEIVYIGQSKNPNLRFAEHRRNGKLFDMVSVFDVSDSSLINEIEADLIVRENPKLNQRIHANRWVGRCDDNDPDRCFSRSVKEMKFCADSNEHYFIDTTVSYKYRGATCGYELYDKDGNPYHVSPKHVMRKESSKDK